MPVITLTTDWNKNDHYCGAVKGKIISLYPNATIVDISHRVETFNIAQAAFILKNSYRHFPGGSVHTVWVNSENSENGRFLAALYEGHFFIAADNGLFGLLFKKEAEKIVNLNSAKGEKNDAGKTGLTEETTGKKGEGCSFAAFSVFCYAACHLASGKDMSELGEGVTSCSKSTPRRATIDEDVITGSVIYIDSYQNAITNITRDLFERVGRGRSFEILVQSNHYRITRLNETYGETSPGEMLALFNSLDLLEVAINKGNIAQLLNLDTNSNVRVKFRGKK